MALSTSDIPQANDPERLLRLARHLATGEAISPPFKHPRDQLLYLGALRALRALDEDNRPTYRLNRLAHGADPRRSFADVFATSPVGAAWLAWHGVARLAELDPASAANFLIEVAQLSVSTARRSANTLKRWLEWCGTAEPTQIPSPPPVVLPHSAFVAEPAPPWGPPALSDPHRLLAGIAHSRVELELKTIDLCFLAALHLRASRASIACFEDDQLVDVFGQVCELVEPEAGNPRVRATRVIQKLREQRLLIRVDHTGLVRAGEYTLSRLAAAIVEFFIQDTALTKESLQLLTGTLKLGLVQILTDAQKAQGAAWRTQVVGPLQVTIGDLVAGIERRQRGLDAQQEELQREIGRLLQDDWFAAVGLCEKLLEESTHTLGELNEILLRDTHQLVAVLQEIQQCANEAGENDAEEASQRVIEQIDQISAWGAARQLAWSAYYQYVHRFLREVVRLDPDRALSQRLRDLIAEWPKRPFANWVASSPPIQLMRLPKAQVPQEPVVRPRRERERELEVVPPEDMRAWLGEHVLAALASGATSLHKVTATVLSEVEEPQHFVVAGRIASMVAELAHITRERVRPWVSGTEQIELEDWAIDGVREPR